MFCPQCGKEQFAESKFCAFCGASLTPAAEPAPEPAPFTPTPAPFAEEPAPFQPQTAPVQAAEPVEIRAEKKRSKKAPILIGAGALVLALLVGLGLWFLLRKPAKQGGPRTVKEDMTAVSEEVDTYLRRLPNLSRMLDNLSALDKSGGCRIGADVRFEIGDTTVAEQIQMSHDFSGERSLTEMNIGYGGRMLGYLFYLDPDQIQIGSDALFGEGKVYCIPLENFEERWKNSAIGKMVGSDVSLSLFNTSGANLADNISVEKIEAALERLYGQDWITFRDSVKLESCEAAECFAGMGTAYTLVWDHESIAKLGGKAEETLKEQEDSLSGLLSGLGLNMFLGTSGASSRQNEEIDPNELFAHGVVYVLSEIDRGVQDEHITNQICKNDKQQLVGLRLADDGAHEVVVLLTGEEYPWTHITATSNGAEALDFTLEQTASSLKAVLRVTEDPEDADSPRHTVELNYDDDTGRVDFNVDGAGKNQINGSALELILRPDGDGVSARMKLDQDFGTSYAVSIDMNLTAAPLRTTFKALSDAPIDLLAMSENEIQALLDEVEQRGSAYFGD